MSLTIPQIDEWAKKRFKTASNEWETDVLFCISYGMENCGPCYGTWDRNPTVSKSYVRLVEIACEYLRHTKSTSELRIFCERVFNYGISYLNESRKKRFAEQTAWLLNLPEFIGIIEKFILPFNATVPDTTTVCTDWQTARAEYKRRNQQTQSDPIFD
ncbi:MAG: hypothetical protein Q8R30_00355 [bacterium]|nr:hypothetical protein [bacterium]MDZ4286046.1 hypothetical protein [Candidatus Sungbacteria bacterium]